MASLILALNCGSSSIKFALFDGAASPLPREPLWGGVERGLDGAAPYHAALEAVRTRALERAGDAGLAAIVHRVVHGGSRYAEPVRLDAAVLADLRRCIPLAPLHQPFALDAIDLLLAAEPGVPQVACFDTAFHRTLPAVERRLPLPAQYAERGVQRYGFHGLSYEYLALALEERHGDAARGRTIVAHLGSGASLCAMRDLRSVATTMGFSALDGLMMGTRCGALDPGVLLYLLETERLTPAQLSDLLYHRSGLLGVSGTSADPQALLQREADDERARDALALYVRGIVREIGALAALLGGLDLLVFSAGVGEHNAAIRQRVCGALSYLGAALDDEANAAHRAVISTAASAVRLAVEPTNEEWMAASLARDLLAR